MLTTYIFENGRPVQIEAPEDPTCLTGASWLDLVDPSDEERAAVTAYYRQELPDTEDVEEIEASARSYEDEAGLHIHSLFLHDVDGRARNTSVAFTIKGDRLFTLREREIPAFRLLRMRARHDRTIARDPICTILS